MTLVMKISQEAEPDVALGSDGTAPRRPNFYLAVAALAFDAAAVGMVFAAGHPLIAAWLALICFALLFLGGAANASDRR